MASGGRPSHAGLQVCRGGCVFHFSLPSKHSPESECQAAVRAGILEEVQDLLLVPGSCRQPVFQLQRLRSADTRNSMLESARRHTITALDAKSCKHWRAVNSRSGSMTSESSIPSCKYNRRCKKKVKAFYWGFLLLKSVLARYTLFNLCLLIAIGHVREKEAVLN